MNKQEQKTSNKKIIYFHNLGFDSLFFIRDLYNTFHNINIIKNSGSIMLIQAQIKKNYRKKGKFFKQNLTKIEFRDSLSLFPFSINKIGKLINLPKLKFDFDYSNFNKAYEYCKRDCLLIYKALDLMVNYLRKFGKDYNINQLKEFSFSDLKLTIPSMSKMIIQLFYPKIFYDYDYYINKNLREYYFGGRTECFNFSELRNGVYFDFNSLYPFVMSKYEFCLGKAYMIDINHSFNELFKDKNTIAYIITLKEKQFYPLFPVRKDGKVFFKNGLKKVFISKSEFNYLKQHNYFDNNRLTFIKTDFIIKSLEGTSSIKLMKDFYDYRKSFPSNHPFNTITKLFMNSGYGKFAEKNEKEQIHFVSDLKGVDFEKENIMFKNGFFIKRKEFTADYLQTNLVNGVLTTSYARFELWKKLIYCYKNNIDVYYCDTDSIVVSKDDYNKYLKKFDGKDLGKLEIEKEFNTFQVIDSKEYYYNDKKNDFNITYKGVKNDLLNSKSDLIKHIKKGTKQNLIPSFFYSIFREKQIINNAFIIKKHKNSFFYKRIIQDDLKSKPLQENDFELLEFIEYQNKQKILNQILN